MIINADDFGYSQSVNDAITECFKKGYINRATILVNMPETENAVKLAKENGFFDKVGLHLNLTEGVPLTEECRKSALCDSNGVFTGKFHIQIKSRFFLKKETMKAISVEADAQMKKFFELGFTLRHLDSHNYTHTYLSVFTAISPAIKKYGFTSMRISRNIPGIDVSRLFCYYKKLYNNAVKHMRVNGERLMTTAFFGSIQDFEKTARKEKKSYGTEIMTHPDYIDGVLMDNTLPCPHPFIDEAWLKENYVRLDDVSGKKTKLLVVFIHAHLGGAMTSLVNFLNALDTDKYEVDVMFYEKGEGRYGIKDSVLIRRSGKIHSKYSIGNILKKGFSPSYLWAKVREQYYKHIKHNKRKARQIMSAQGCRYSRKLYKRYDIAIAYECAWALNYVNRRVKADKKIYWHHMDPTKSGLDFGVDKAAFDKASALVFVSNTGLESYKKMYPEHSDKCYFVPNLLSTEYVRNRGEEEVSLPFEVSDDELVFASVSRLSHEKGIDRGIKVFERLKKDGKLDKVKWFIIGSGTLYDETVEMINSAGLSDCVFALGAKDNPIPYLKKADVMFLPSRHEGKPMVITEGFIMGLVPVVAEYSSANEQIRNGVDGIILENSDEALYEGVKKILENRGQIREMKKNIMSKDYGNTDEIKYFYDVVDKLK